MAESRRDQIIDALIAKLAAIVGDAGVNYWYTPGAIKCVEGFSVACLDDSFANALDDGKTTLYLLAPDEEQDIEDLNFSVEAIMSLDLLVARQIDQADHPLKEASTGSCRKIQNRLARDVKKKLREDVALGGLCINVETQRTEFAAEEVGAGGAWACVLFRLAIHYEYWSATP